MKTNLREVEMSLVINYRGVNKGMSGCLYVKRFEDGSIYVGCTNEYNRRMSQHNHHCYNPNSNKFNIPLYQAMRSMAHTTEIWAEGIEDMELLYQLEIQTIAQLRDEGIKLLNVTVGGLGSLGLKGELNPKSKPKEYYETNAVTRGSFKRPCKNQGWCFNDFDERFTGEYYIQPSNNRRIKLYTYTLRKIVE